MLPKRYRDTLGLAPGVKVDITPYGAGLALVPEGRSARLVRDEGGHLVVDTDQVFTDAEMYALIDEGRK